MQCLFLMKSGWISSTPGDLLLLKLITAWLTSSSDIEQLSNSQLVATTGWGSTVIGSETWVCNLGVKRVEEYFFQQHRTFPSSDCSTALESITEFGSSKAGVCPRYVIPSNRFQNCLGLDFLCRNHAWISFQSFAETFTDAFRLPSGFGKCCAVCDLSWPTDNIS